MNIFVLDYDQEKAAQYHNDKHIVKMVLEYAQLLSSVHRIHNSPFADNVYRLTHKNHPCAIWARESYSNYDWLYTMFQATALEYTNRYSRVHKSFAERSAYLRQNCLNIDKGLTPFPLCMPDQYKTNDAVESYRAYYMGEKRHIAQWKFGAPFWWS